MFRWSGGGLTGNSVYSQVNIFNGVNMQSMINFTGAQVRGRGSGVSGSHRCKC